MDKDTELAKALAEYQDKNICKYASDKCKKCVCRMSAPTGCAFNLVMNIIEYGLSSDSETALKQYQTVLGLNTSDINNKKGAVNIMTNRREMKYSIYPHDYRFFLPVEVLAVAKKRYCKYPDIQETIPVSHQKSPCIQKFLNLMRRFGVWLGISERPNTVDEFETISDIISRRIFENVEGVTVLDFQPYRIEADRQPMFNCDDTAFAISRIIIDVIREKLGVEIVLTM